MKPREEVLTALLSKARERKILVYDLEAKDGDTQNAGFTRVFLAGMFDGARFEAFRNHPDLAHAKGIGHVERAWQDGGCIDALMRTLLQRKFRGHYIYAHNGGGFDHLHLLPWLTSHVAEFSYVIVPIQSTIQMMKVTERSSKQCWTFLDSMRVLPMGLDKAAKALGYEGKLNHCLDMHEDDPRWVPYLKQDNVALYNTLTRFQEIIKDEMGGELGITTPSTAMKLFRRRYMGHGKTPAMIEQHRHFKECDGLTPLPAPSVEGARGGGEASAREACNACLHDWIRLAYYGGRTEVFRSRGRKLSYYDINSSYPRAMLEDMPAGVVKQYGPKKGLDDFKRLERDAIGFVECEVYIPESCYLPPLPFRDESRGGKLIFPTGIFRGVWSWDELKLLFDPLVNGKIRNITRSVWYGRKTLFFDFVKELYAYRDKKSAKYDEGMALIAKLMMNALYGKFGMNEDRREILLLGPGEATPEGATFPRHASGDEDFTTRVCYVEKHVTPPYVIPQISAQITSLARIRLWHCMADVVRRGGALYYCDTDSLITDLADLPTSTELGALKNEYPGEFLDVRIGGAKMYELRREKAFDKEHLPSCANFDGRTTDDAECPGCATVKVTMKGIPRKLRTPDSFQHLLDGGKVEFFRLERLGAMAEKGFKVAPRMKKASKSHLGKHTKRVWVDEVGSDSFPIHLTT